MFPIQFASVNGGVTQAFSIRLELHDPEEEYNVRGAPSNKENIIKKLVKPTDF